MLPTRWTLFTKNTFWLLFMIKWCEKVTAAESVEEEGAHASSPRLEHEEWADRRYLFIAISVDVQRLAGPIKGLTFQSC